MVHLKIKKGLDLPIEGYPKGNTRILDKGKFSALDLTEFSQIRLHLLKKIGEEISIGEPLVEDKDHFGRYFLSPSAGVISDIFRGEKRSLSSVIIENRDEKYYEHKVLSESADKAAILDFLKTSGVLGHILLRPFATPPKGDQIPSRIFVKAVESAPFVPPPEMQLEGNEEDFQNGLQILSKIVDGNIHVVYQKESKCKAALHAEKGYNIHTVEGPHPMGNASVHIHKIAPIQNISDFVWVLNLHDVITFGKLLLKGKYHIEKVIGFGGPSIPVSACGFYKSYRGISVKNLLPENFDEKNCRVISGDPLTGKNYFIRRFLGFYDSCFSIFPETDEREFLHFFQLGSKKFTATKTYLSGFFQKKNFPFTTKLNGERRAFVDGNIYEKVMPIRVPTMHLIKAILAEDYSTAEKLGFLEVVPEDFALPSFICPSKIEMSQIVKEGLKKFANEVL